MLPVRVDDVDEGRVPRIQDLVEGLDVGPFVQRSRRIQSGNPVDFLVALELELVAREGGDLCPHAVAYHVNRRHPGSGRFCQEHAKISELAGDDGRVNASFGVDRMG